jgi:hypothetical protein
VVVDEGFRRRHPLGDHEARPHRARQDALMRRKP